MSCMLICGMIIGLLALRFLTVSKLVLPYTQAWAVCLEEVETAVVYCWPMGELDRPISICMKGEKSWAGRRSLQLRCDELMQAQLSLRGPVTCTMQKFAYR